MVFAAGLDALELKSQAYVNRLKKIGQICKRYRMEIIPMIYSVGYGSGLAFDRNLAEGLPVRDVLFQVKDQKAQFVQDHQAQIINGGFEEHRHNQVDKFTHDHPGKVSFVDDQVFKSGTVSLRFENVERYPYGLGRLMQEVKLRPFRHYEVSFWVKSENTSPGLQLKVLTSDKRTLLMWNVQTGTNRDWLIIRAKFNSMNYDKVKIYVGMWNGRSGRYWIDDINIKELALTDIIRRSGTPLVVRNEVDDVIFSEGRDYLLLSSRTTDVTSGDAKMIVIPGGSRIKDSVKLRVTYYHGMAVRNGQVTVCMSDPKLYAIWEKQLQLIQEVLSPRRYFLSMDEIRAGGTCQSCSQRGLTMAQILGDCITRQHKIIHHINPGAEVFIWSDMLDPNHNAHNDYFLVNGDFSGSWKYIPKDMVIVCWHYDKRHKSLDHFSSQGFRTMAGAYYDADNLDHVKGWLDQLERTPGAQGIMYTTWRNKYGLLAEFGNMAAKKTH
jgi:hypothetical protein